MPDTSIKGAVAGGQAAGVGDGDDGGGGAGRDAFSAIFPRIFRHGAGGDGVRAYFRHRGGQVYGEREALLVDIADKIGAVLIAAGSAWVFLGALGLLRFPDVYTRLHGAGLSSTAGITMILLGVTAYFSTRQPAISLLSTLALFFILLGGPVTTTAIGWMAHRTQTPAHQEQLTDELEEDDAKH
ncbi:MAG: hypothetical protein FJ320_11815, partial [SAR202 cluster bacterium]|nr:hypothetical protein [SAR202 cluster bacterium]